ncbi:MAG: hypothetical protein IPM18_01485 [Phycisphaerales bacterium]|nr:hypothetical protein [Phycisphaerales bacterium]
MRREVREDQGERLADQVANAAGADAQRREIGQDGLFDVGLTPAEPRMARRRGVVGAAIVDVLVDAAVLQTIHH